MTGSGLSFLLIVILFHFGCSSLQKNNPYEAATLLQANQFKRTRLPFPPRTNFLISQGAFGRQSHIEQGNEYSWDFDVPLGTSVVAVEDGKVIDVWEPNLGGGCDEKYNNTAHNIKVQHEDGSVAQYVHVASQIKLGEEVREGQVIATTAVNGWICQPQLHFGIYRSKDQLYNSTHRETLPLLFDGLPKQGLAAPGISGTVPDGIVIRLVKDTPQSIETKRILEGLVKKYDLSPYFFTTKIQIEQFAVPHDYPILTLNTRHNDDPDFLLSTFLHEEIHHFVNGPNKGKTQGAIKELHKKFLHVPIGGVEGGNDEDSTYLHLIVCWLELQADKKYLGDSRAYEVIRKTDHYTWIYKQVLDQEKNIGSLIERHGLSFRRANGADVGSLIPQPFNRSA